MTSEIDGGGPLLQMRQMRAAQWSATDPVLSTSAAGYETDTHKLKIGDGHTAWSGLPYITGGGGGSLPHHVITVAGITPVTMTYVGTVTGAGTGFITGVGTVTATANPYVVTFSGFVTAWTAKTGIAVIIDKSNKQIKVQYLQTGVTTPATFTYAPTGTSASVDQGQTEQVKLTATKLGFFAAAATTKPVIPATPTVTDVVTALTALGLVS